jgi:hypothetical protein
MEGLFMSDFSHDERLSARSISFEQAVMLMEELNKRMSVVSEQALGHLMSKGVIAAIAREGCCKPDGGTCCPNKKIVMRPESGLGLRA